jgi:hypothetical protein
MAPADRGVPLRSGRNDQHFLFSQALAIPLQPASKLFLFAHLTPAGLRVSCFENKHLRFSRLTVSSAPGPDSDTTFVVDEIRRSYDYLLSQRALPHNRPTVACILVADDAARDALQAAQFASPGLTLQPVLMAEASAALRLVPPGAGASNLPLLIQTFATRRRLPVRAHRRPRRAAPAAARAYRGAPRPSS